MLSRTIALLSVIMFFIALCCVCVGGIVFR